ncbi:MAG TPA: hypothetical protein PKI11_00490, partial [Candidatus Hydrogenedentes bacterium]|nr:hypothetical protein [Candidatus Hydrogenedentota bacterium]
LYWQYGHMPPPPPPSPGLPPSLKLWTTGRRTRENLRAVEETSEAVCDGLGVMRRATLVMGPEDQVRVRVAVFLPRDAAAPSPVVLAVEPVWEEHLRPVARRMLERGYGFAGFDRHDLDADSPDRTDGVHPLYPDYDWASLAVWAWGCMRVMDFLETVDGVDAAKVALTGHSRAGKTALLAGALDERFAVVAPHASGTGGAGAYRVMGRGAETLALITSPDRFHYWFHSRLALFAGHEDRLPFDQHFLKALVAPRALICIEGRDDLWANPVGTQATTRAAQPVFDFLGTSGRNGLHIRPGGHDTTPEDWEILLDFANHVFRGAPDDPKFHTMPFPHDE